MLIRFGTEFRMNEMWKDGFPGLHESFNILGQMLDYYHPKIFKHLQATDLQPSLYATQWFLTGYLYNLPFALSLRIWDILLFEGRHFLFAVALSIFKYFEGKILAQDFDTNFQFLCFTNEKKR